MLFWIICAVLAICVSGLIALAIWRSGRDAAPAAAFDMQVYRDQLAEVDRDANRGVLGSEDAARARTEISRRILATDKALQDKSTQAHRSSRPVRIAASAVMAVALIGGSLWMYSSLGAPGYGDLPLKTRIKMAEERHKNRPSQQEAEASIPAATPSPDLDPDYVKLVEKLRQAVETRPGDLQGAQLLARHEMALGNVKEAYKAQSQVIGIKKEQATAEDFARFGDMLVIAAGGYVSPEAEAALVQALRKDPKNGVARYYSGLLASQIDRPDVAFRTWATLLRDGPADAPWVTPVREQIEDMAFRAGVEYTLPPLETTRGPSAEDVANAAGMSKGDRMQMIRGMVEQLSDRLATEGGPPEEWAKLISSLGVLGETDRAKAIYDNAKEVFADNAAVLGQLKQAAQGAGIAE